jgi:nitrogen regulatory protein PII
MKLIIAIIHESQLELVREALVLAGISRITASRVSGHGKQRKEEIYRGKKVIPNLNPKMRIEIAVNDEFVDTTINTIMKSAKRSDEGEVGDGKIFIIPLEDCIRIRTGEKGSSAI